MGRLRSGTRLREVAGFSFIELLVALAATVIVMGAVFGLLARGSGTHGEEMERADLQAQARAALQMLSQDVIMAGGDLPPEIPAFRTASSPLATRRTAPSIEMLGNFEDDAGGGGAVPVIRFDGRVAQLGSDPTRFHRGDLVLVYDDQPIDGKWVFAVVESVVSGTSPELSLLTAPGARIDDTHSPIALPETIESYNRPTPASGFVTPVTVISYGLDADPSSPDSPTNSLWRQVNWGDPVSVARIDDLEIRYFVGGTVSDTVVPPPPSDPTGPRPQSLPRGRFGSAPPSPEGGIPYPPDPQPVPSRVIAESRLIQGVRISVTSHSRSENLRGATLEPGADPTDEAYLRHVVTTRVAPRNLLIQADRRRQQLEEAEYFRESSSRQNR